MSAALRLFSALRLLAGENQAYCRAFLLMYSHRKDQKRRDVSRRSRHSCLRHIYQPWALACARRMFCVNAYSYRSDTVGSTLIAFRAGM